MPPLERRSQASYSAGPEPRGSGVDAQERTLLASSSSQATEERRPEGSIRTNRETKPEILENWKLNQNPIWRYFREV
jgi:hypothetical protein